MIYLCKRVYSSNAFATRHWKEVGGHHHASAALPLPPGKTRYPLYRRLGWPRGREISPHRDSIPGPSSL